MNTGTHGRILSRWTGSGDAQRRVNQENSQAMQLASQQQQMNQIRQAEIEEKNKQFEESIAQADYLSAQFPSLKKNVQNAFNENISIIKEKLKFYNNDSNRFFNEGGGRELIDNLMASVRAEVPNSLKEDVVKYLEATKDHKNKHLIPLRTHLLFEQAQSGQIDAKDFYWSGMLQDYEKPTQADINAGASMGMDRLDVLLEVGNNVTIARGNIMMEEGLSASEAAQLTAADIKSYIARYRPTGFQPNEKSSKDSKSNVKTSTSGVIQGITNNLNKSKISGEDWNTLFDNPDYKELSAFLNLKPMVPTTQSEDGTPPLNPMGWIVDAPITDEVLSSVFGASYIKGIKQQKQIISGGEKLDTGEYYMTSATGSVYSSGRNEIFDQNGMPVEAGKNFVDYSLGSKINLIAFFEGVDENGNVTLKMRTQDNQGESVGKPIIFKYAVKMQSPAYVESEDGFWQASEDQKTIYKIINENQIQSAKLDKDLGIDSRLKNSNRSNVRENGNILPKEGIKNYNEYILNIEDFDSPNASNLKEGIATFIDGYSEPYQNKLSKVGLGNISIQNKSALMGMMYYNIVETSILSEGDSDAINASAIAMLEYTDRLVKERPDIFKALQQPSPEEYYNLIEEIYAKDDPETSENTMKSIKRLQEFFFKMYKEFYTENAEKINIY
jgi:hypothetical protein